MVTILRNYVDLLKYLICTFHRKNGHLIDDCKIKKGHIDKNCKYVKKVWVKKDMHSFNVENKEPKMKWVLKSNK